LDHPNVDVHPASALRRSQRAGKGEQNFYYPNAGAILTGPDCTAASGKVQAIRLTVTGRIGCRVPGEAFLPHFEVFGRRFSPIAYDLELDVLALIKGAETRLLHRRNMNKHVLPAALRLDEPISLGRIEPLHRSGRHYHLQLIELPWRGEPARFRRFSQ
jgi:hypothetical protein